MNRVMSWSGTQTKGTQTMKGKRFTAEEKIRILRDADQRSSITETCTYIPPLTSDSSPD